MEERELRRIQKSLVRANENCSTEVACLMTVINYYGGKEKVENLMAWSMEEEERNIEALRKTAIRAGMIARLDVMTVEDLLERKLPIVLYTKNDFGEFDYAVCFGFHEERFILWEPGFGPMQYWPEELEALWEWGICMVVYPGAEFVVREESILWWGESGWKAKCRRKLETVRDYWELEILPRLRR